MRLEVHTAPEEFENATITDRFGVFRPNINAKLVFSISSDLKSVSEKLPFRDGLVWTAGLTVKIKLRFQISQG